MNSNTRSKIITLSAMSSVITILLAMGIKIFPIFCLGLFGISFLTFITFIVIDVIKD